MENQWKISFENMGMSSYLAVTFPLRTDVIGYQMEMITSNEINHLLRASKRMINGQTGVYYNISSKIQLSRILERRKLSRKELLALIQGALDAAKDGKEYQLSEDGLVMEPEYIYVEPDTCSPYFLYLPVNRQEKAGIREFLTSLIVHGRIEMSNDNLIQVLLEAVNRQPFSLTQLEECVKKLQGKGEQIGKVIPEPFPINPQVFPSFSPENDSANRGSDEYQRPPVGVMGGTPVNWNSKKRQEEPKVDMAEGKQEEDPPKLKKNLPVKPGKEKREKPEKKKEKKNENVREKENGEFDREKAKKKFLLPQALIMVLLAALVSFGAFTDSEGKIVLNNLLAVVLIVAVTEVILYREAFVNGKDKNGKKRPKKESKKERKSPPVPKARKEEKNSGRPPVPKKEKRQDTPVPENPQPSAGDLPRAGAASYKPEFRYTQEFHPQAAPAEISSETELWEGDSDEGAYLEYYVNGVLSRVMLNKPSTLIGRLSGQVDFAVSNPKVGKIHAEFLNQNGMIYVKDLNSKNGTYINRSGQRINSNIPYPLKDNDRISLADSDFTLRCGQR